MYKPLITVTDAKKNILFVYYAHVKPHANEIMRFINDSDIIISETPSKAKLHDYDVFKNREEYIIHYKDKYLCTVTVTDYHSLPNFINLVKTLPKHEDIKAKG